MDAELRSPIESEDYADLIVFYLNNSERLSQYENAALQYMNETFAIVHVPVYHIKERVINTLGYTVIPKLYGVTSSVSLEVSGVPKLRTIPSFNLRGCGVLIGIIDQTLASGTAPVVTGFGSEYNGEQINQALALENPYEIVPSIDEINSIFPATILTLDYL